MQNKFETIGATEYKHPDGSTSLFGLKKSRQEDIQNMFENIDPMYAKVYQCLLVDYPELDQVEIKIGTKEEYPVLEYTGGFWETPDLDNPDPLIIFEASGRKHYEKLLQEREISARATAKMLGVDFPVLQEHPDVFSVFIFLHEFGHIHDFIKNYVDTSPDVIRAVEKNRGVRNMEMNSLPIPGRNPVDVRQMADGGELERYLQTYWFYFEGKGIASPDALIKAHEEAYRNLPSEVHADRFAATVLQKHWVDVGFDAYGGFAVS